MFAVYLPMILTARVYLTLPGAPPLAVVSPPAGEPVHWVTPSAGEVSRFVPYDQPGALWLTAHEHLAGAHFKRLAVGDRVSVGAAEYQVRVVAVYRWGDGATWPDVYAEHTLTLQTCVPGGLLFVIADSKESP